jgi:hypothetical protein
MIIFVLVNFLLPERHCISGEENLRLHYGIAEGVENPDFFYCAERDALLY